MAMKLKYIVFILIVGLINSNSSFSNDYVSDVDKLFDLSIEEMMNIKVVSSSFTGIDKIKTPASITLITSEDIALTPFRNLYDLLEVYVPAAIWMTHYDSPHIGIRGLINQRNDKILLLVNGKNMNFKARNGATSELENWDLSDIEQIEIIRGPGSVIYGPGAIEAVINITTKKYEGKDNFTVNLRNYNPYQSFGGNISINQSITDEIKLSAFASIISSGGYSAEKGFYIPDNNAYTEIGVSKNSRKLQDLFVDSDDRPQIKANINLELSENTNIWLRYTRSGSTLNGLTFKYSYQTGFLPAPDLYTLSEPFNFNSSKNEQFVVAVENKSDLGNGFMMKSMLSFDSEYNQRSQDYLQIHPQEWAPKDSSIMMMLRDPNSLRNRYFEGSENELQLRAIITKEESKSFSYALGMEYSYNFWGKGWFKEDGYFRFGDNWNIISDKSSPAYGYPDYFGTDTNDTYFVGNGWATNTIALFGEANYKLNDDLTILLSGRIDKDDYSAFMFSPRLAFIWSVGEYDYLKLIVQRSLRMNTAEELLIQHLKGIEPNTEALDNVELIFTSLQSSNFVMNVSAFYSNVEILTWRDPIRSTILSGSLNLAGIEFESRFHNNSLDIIFNHSFIKQLSWKLEPNVFQSGISFSDYYKELKAKDTNFAAPILAGVGNDLNNLSNHTTKLIINYKIIEDYLLLHIDSRIYWGLQGAKDGLEMLRNSLPNSIDSAKTSNLIDLMEKYDTYGIDFRLNASLRVNILSNLSLSIFAMNILDLTNNRRLRYDTGSKEEKYSDNGDLAYRFMMKNSMYVEPFTLGVNLSFKLN